MPAINTDARRRARMDDEIVLGVLDAVESDPAVTQRSVARELGIALGLANAYLKRCVRKGLIKINQVPSRRYVYYLTPQGFAEKSRLTASYLSNSFLFFRSARAQCGEIFAAASTNGQRRLTLIGPGDLAEIAILVARDYPVEIAGIAAAVEDGETLAAGVTAFGSVDAVVVCALENSRNVFDTAVVTFGAARVYAPSLLRVRATAHGEAQGVI